jgi:hypothetical protein
MTQLSRSQLDAKQKHLLAEMEKTGGARNDVLFVNLLHDVATAMATVPAKEFLGRVSEAKEEEQEEKDFQKDAERIYKQRNSLSGDQYRQATAEIARVWAHRGRDDDAIEILEAITRSTSGGLGGMNPEKMSGPWSDELFKQVFGEIPIDRILKSPKAYIDKLEPREQFVIMPELIDRFREAGELFDAHKVALMNLEKHQEALEGTNEHTFGGDYIGTTRKLAKAEIDSGLYDESRELEEALNNIRGGATKSIFEIRAHRAEGYAEAGLFTRAIEESRNLEYGDLRQEVIEAIVKKALEEGDHDAAWSACFSEAGTVFSSKSAADVLLKMQEDEIEFEDRYEQWKALITSDDYAFANKIKDSIQLARVDREVGHDTSEHINTLLEQVREMGGEQVDLMFRVNLLKAHRKIDKGINLKLFEEIVQVYRDLITRTRDKLQVAKIFKELVDELGVDGHYGLANQIAEEVQGGGQYLSRAKRGAEVMRWVIKNGDYTKQHIRESKDDVEHTLAVGQILIEEGKTDDAWELARQIRFDEETLKASDRMRGYLDSGSSLREAVPRLDKLKTNILLARVTEFTGEDTRVEAEKLMNWTREIKNSKFREEVLIAYVHKFGAAHPGIMRRLENVVPKLHRRLELERISKGTEKWDKTTRARIEIHRGGTIDMLEDTGYISAAAIAEHNEDDGYFSKPNRDLRGAIRELKTVKSVYDIRKQIEAAEYIALAYARMGNFKKAFDVIDIPILRWVQDEKADKRKEEAKLKVIQVFREQYTA